MGDAAGGLTARGGAIERQRAKRQRAKRKRNPGPAGWPGVQPDTL